MATTIAFFGPLPPRLTGMAAVNQAAIDALAATGHRVRAHGLSPAGGVRVWWNHGLRMGRFAKAIAWLITHRRYDLGYMSVDSSLGLIYSILIAFSIRLIGKPVFVHHHNFAYIDRVSGLMRLFLRLAPPRQTHVFLCARMRDAFEASYAKQMPKSFRTIVLPNSFMAPPPRPQQKPSAAGGPLLIGHLSNLSREKGTDLFLDLFETLTGRGANVGARLAGPVTDPLLKARIEQLRERYPETFFYTGSVYGPAKFAFLDEVDVFVFPSRSEAQPLVLLEALSSGCVLATVSRGCIGCDHAESGAFIAPHTDAFVADAPEWIDRLALDPTGVARLQRAAQDHVAKLIASAPAARADWLALIDRVAREGTRVAI